MEDARSEENSDSIDATPKTENVQNANARDSLSEGRFRTALSKCAIRKLAKAAKKTKEMSQAKHPFLLSQRSRDKAQEVHQKLSKWYGSTSKVFLMGQK
jgi:hypothetical protein